MKRFPHFVLLMLLFLTACGGIPALNPTATPAPTQTLEPTQTPQPTETVTPSPTSTPNMTATAGAQATETAASVLDELDQLLADTDIPYKDGHLAWQQTKALSIDLSGPDDQILAIDEELSAKDFILKSDVTWNASGIIICGAVFRSEPDLERGKQYRFFFLRLSGLPAWEINVFEFGQYRNSPSDTQFSSALDQSNNATNEFVLIVQDDQFNLYLNDHHEGRYFDYSNQRTQGSFAFLGFQDSGRGSCEFENSWVWVLE